MGPAAHARPGQPRRGRGHCAVAAGVCRAGRGGKQTDIQVDSDRATTHAYMDGPPAAARSEFDAFKFKSEPLGLDSRRTGTVSPALGRRAWGIFVDTLCNRHRTVTSPGS
jgi:hypothetical protein